MKLKVILAAVVYVIWALFLLTWTDSLVRDGQPWSIAEFGQFGDAFGPLNAVMVSLAAFFTWRALQHEREQASRVSAEQTFFKLLDTRTRLLGQVEYDSEKGVEAFAAMRQAILDGATEEMGENYGELHRESGNVLHTYFRITYHALALIRDRFDSESAYRFAQILRAELSSPEQFLIGVNAAWRFPKMLKLVNQFSILHTMPKGDWSLLKSAFPAIEDAAWESKSQRDGQPD